jgi:curved DNA-binding protein CbpA
MTDYFSLFGITPSPWIDAEGLKNKFHQLTARHHPDVTTDDAVDFAQLTAAFNTLSDPVMRLRYYLDVRFAGSLTGRKSLPLAVAGVFPEANAKVAALTEFLDDRSKADNPIAAALLAPRQLALVHDLERFLGLLAMREKTLLEELQKTDPESSERLCDIYQQLAFFKKWSGQLREGLNRIAAHV